MDRKTIAAALAFARAELALGPVHECYHAALAQYERAAEQLLAFFDESHACDICEDVRVGGGWGSP